MFRMFCMFFWGSPDSSPLSKHSGDALRRVRVSHNATAAVGENMANPETLVTGKRRIKSMGGMGASAPSFDAPMCSGVTMTAKTSLNALKGQESGQPGGKCKGKLWTMLG